VNPILILAAAVAPAPDAPSESAAEAPETILVTAARVPVAESATPASATLLDRRLVEALDPVLATDLIRLSPGVSVSSSGGAGSLTQVRIRGAEANHSLLFVDGIAFNDLAAGNEPRFETIAASGLERVEIVRGPQSALWGSEALGGVIAVATPDSLGPARGSAAAEYGSHDSARVYGAYASGGERAGVSATAAWARSDGIDILGGGKGDRDGFENVTLSLKGVVRPAAAFEAGAVGRYIRHRNQFDGTNAFFQRADTAEESRADTKAVRGWLSYGPGEEAPWSVRAEAQHLDSRNRNFDAGVHTNDTYGRRTRLGLQAVHRFGAGSSRHALIAAVEREDEDFGTRDRQFGGASDRDLARGRTALVGEWRASWGEALTTDLAVRHDAFTRFRDATTLRANAVLRVGAGVSLLAGYGEGIAQPSFFDLFGFAPNSGFVPNPDLKPERSKGFESGVRWQGRTLTAELVGFSNDLRSEIVEDFTLYPRYTVANAPGASRRRGIEASSEWKPRQGMRIGANYTFLDTRERRQGSTSALREVRRPKHRANLYGDIEAGPLTFGAALAYVGRRIDSDFDLFPAPRIRLGAYVLGSARLAYRVAPRLEAFARVENAFDAQYQDVIGYNTLGRGVYAGLRFRFGD
jgi:vitamin B12 transporter